MAVPILVALVVLLFVGLLLVVLGLRGRRINDHPICRQCRFDLQGVYPAAITCPECGAGLKRAGYVLPGARRRRWVCFSTGIAFVLLPMLTFGALAFGIAAGANINQYKPARLLIWESRRVAGPEHIKELLARYNASSLSDEDIRHGVDAGLDRQGDPARAWHPEWGDFIEAAHGDDKIDDELFRRYLNQTAVFELESRPAVAQGDPIPILIKLKESRTGTTSQIHGMLSLDQARAGPITLRTFNGHSRRSALAVITDWSQSLGEQGPMLGWFQLGSNANIFSGGGNQAARLMLDSVYQGESPAPLDTGPHAFEVAVKFEAQVINYNNPWMPGRKPDNARKLTLAGRVQVTPPDTGVNVVQRDAQIAEQLREALAPSQVVVMNFSGTDNSYAHAQFMTGKLPVGIAFDVLLKADGKTWRMGSLVSGRSADVENFSGYNVDDDSIQRTVQGEIGEFAGDTVTVVLKPRPELAARTVDMDSVYNDEIVFEEVSVMRQGDGRGGAATRRRGFIERLLFGR